MTAQAMSSGMPCDRSGSACCVARIPPAGRSWHRGAPCRSIRRAWVAAWIRGKPERRILAVVATPKKTPGVATTARIRQVISSNSPRRRPASKSPSPGTSSFITGMVPLSRHYVAERIRHPGNASGSPGCRGAGCRNAEAVYGCRPAQVGHTRASFLLLRRSTTSAESATRLECVTTITHLPS